MTTASKLIRRMFALMGVLLLLLSSSADALGLHRCAHHDALPSAESADTSHHGHHPAPDGGDEEKSESCTCVGTCSISTAIVAPRATATIFAAAPRRPGTQVPQHETPNAASAEYLLPWSTAPPVL